MQYESNPPIQYLSLGQRSGAASIDGIAQALAITVASQVWEAVVGPSDTSDWALFAINLLAPTVFILFIWAQLPTTPGMMLYSGRIADAQTGLKPSGTQMMVRFFGSILSTLALGLGFLWIAFTERSQGWHDLMAGTVVVKD